MEELQNHLSFGNIMDENFRMANELTLLAFNIQEEVYVVLDLFLYFKKKYEEKKTHNILFLMLDPKFKNLKLVSSLIG
jgi:hypothetical protein